MIGGRLSHYDVLSELGSGGMGTVYLGECAEAAAGLDAGTRVALKVIHASLLSQPGFFKRFLREAHVGEQVRHDNVVRTYDCDATETEGKAAHFLVMEYVEGQTLRDLLDELERVPEELCRHIGREVARGLAAIHEVGVVHRDIKPENVLITEEHVVKVMDLGVARLQDEAIRLSRTGTFVGSVEYAAPEQFRSQGGPTDHRADLHALGVMLYEMATGQHPYRDTDMHKLLRNILDEEPRKPGEVNPQLSPFFEEVINTLIAKDRDARFADAAGVVQVLEEGEQGQWWKERAKALRIETKRPLRRVRVPRETALYGRDDDLVKLHALFDEAKAGDGRVLLIEGEAGIGKTRLVDEFVGRLRREGEDIDFLFGSYPPGGAATATGAFSEAYREQFGQEGSEPWLAQTPILVPAFDALLRGEPPPKDAEALTKDSLGTVFVHATHNLANERPVIVLIDDLHFAPEDARSLFMTLAMAVPGHPILLVGTMRPGVNEEWVSNVTRLDHAVHLPLSRLSPKNLTKLLMDAFKSERLAQELGFQIAQKSDGNPFFAFEIIRGLREGQFITQEADGTWVSTQVIDDIKIPSNVMDLIQARLQDLTEEERELLDVASCCGFEFDPELVAEVVGMRFIPALRTFGGVENRHRLVRSTGRDFAFDHHQVQEALYGGQPGRLRERYHAAIAEALERGEKAADRDPKDLDGALCVDLCEHFLEGAQGEKALHYLDAALDHVEAGYLNDQAITLADRALDVPNLLRGGRRLDALLRKSDLLDLLGRREAQEAVLSEARSLAEGEEASLARVELGMGLFRWQTGRNEDALPHFQHARALCKGFGDRKGVANATNGLGISLGALGRYAEAKAQHQHALTIRQAIGDQDGEAASTINLGMVFHMLGLTAEARTHYEGGAELARACGNRRWEANATGGLGIVTYHEGCYAEARAHFERALEINREIGARPGEAMDTLNLGNASAAEGRSAEALVCYGRALTMSRETGNLGGELPALINGGTYLALLGALEDAESRLRAALEIGREIGYRWMEAHTLTVLARGLGERGDTQAAEGLHKEALSHYEAMGTRNESAAVAHLRYGVLLARLERTDEAQKRLDEALVMATESRAPGARVLSLVHLALLDGGDPAQAVAALRDDELRMAHDVRTEANFLLYEATSDRPHLEAAHDLLTFWVEHAPEQYRETALTNVELHRDIMKAWEAHGEKGEKEGGVS